MKNHRAPVLTVACFAAVCAACIGWIGLGNANAESLLQNGPPMRIAVVDALAVINQLDELPVRQAEWQSKMDQAQGKLEKLRIVWEQDGQGASSRP